MEFVNLAVGRSLQIQKVHKPTLCEYVPFFQAYFNDNWKGNRRSDPIQLPDDEPKIVDLFLQWLEARSSNGKPSMVNENIIGLSLLVKAFILGDKYLIEHFKVAVMDKIQQVTTKLHESGVTWCSNVMINHIYESTPKHSSLRLLVVDYYFHHPQPNWKGEEFSSEFLQELSQERDSHKVCMFDPRANRGPICVCRYHEHIHDCLI